MMTASLEEHLNSCASCTLRITHNSLRKKIWSLRRLLKAGGSQRRTTTKDDCKRYRTFFLEKGKFLFEADMYMLSIMEVFESRSISNCDRNHGICVYFRVLE